MFWVYLILIIAVMISGSSVFIIKNNDEKRHKLLLAFSGAFLLGISFTHLIPEIFGAETGCLHEHHHHEQALPVVFLGAFILLGFLLQLFLELMTHGIEHGHSNTHHQEGHFSPVPLMIGLCIHSFLEGIPLINQDLVLNRSLALGIIIHNIPIAMVLMSLFLNAGKTKLTAYVWLFVFASMTPLGSLSGLWVLSYLPFDYAYISRFLMALVVGIFLHVSTSILFETSETHQYNTRKFVVVVVGMLAAILLPV